MRSIPLFLALCACPLLFLADAGVAQDKKDAKKDVVLKGTVTCGKCDLGVDKQCATVIVVKDDKTKKDIVYYFDKDSHTKYHDGVCTDPKKGTVEATIVDAGKKVISVKKVTYDK